MMAFKKFEYLHFSKKLYEATYRFTFIISDHDSELLIQNTQGLASMSFPIRNKKIDWLYRSYSFPYGIIEAADFQLRKIYLTAFS